MTYPPKSVEDVLAYDRDEMIMGYLDGHNGEPEPGDNRTPGYRWGWSNARADRYEPDDGLNWLRLEMARLVIDGKRHVHH